jgi:hypothetical protein
MRSYRRRVEIDSNGKPRGRKNIIPADSIPFMQLQDTADRLDESMHIRSYGNGGWIALLCMGYIVNRIIALIPLPSTFHSVSIIFSICVDDAQHHTWLGHSRNLTDLVLLGCPQAWLTGLASDPTRWSYLAKHPGFFVAFFASGVAFSILTSFPGFDGAIDDNLTLPVFFAVVIGSLVIVCAGVIVWHIVHARRILISRTDFYRFILTRVTLLVVLSVTYFLIHSEENSGGFAKLHLHHYFVAWILSLIACFNHKISIYFLAITTGIFVQGISAYSAASMFYRGDHQIPCPEVHIA